MLLRSSSRGNGSSNGSVAAAVEFYCNAPKVQLGNRTPFHFKGKRNWYRHLKGARSLLQGQAVQLSTQLCVAHLCNICLFVGSFYSRRLCKL